MRKLIAGINMSLDGYCDHTVGIVDAALHDYFTDMLRQGGALLYGRITFQMMESYWPEVLKNPTGEKDSDDFALAIEEIPKIVFSRTLKSVHWGNSKLATRDLAETVAGLKRQPGKDILLGSPSLIAAATEQHLVDEYRLCLHPVIAGKGLPLFRNITEKQILKLVNTRTFSTGSMALTYVRS